MFLPWRHGPPCKELKRAVSLNLLINSFHKVSDIEREHTKKRTRTHLTGPEVCARIKGRSKTKGATQTSAPPGLHRGSPGVTGMAAKGVSQERKSRLLPPEKRSILGRNQNMHRVGFGFFSGHFLPLQQFRCSITSDSCAVYLIKIDFH